MNVLARWCRNERAGREGIATGSFIVHGYARLTGRRRSAHPPAIFVRACAP